MNKVVVCDLDDTLLLREYEKGMQRNVIRVADENAIQAWIQEGNRFVIGTARHSSFLPIVTKKPSLKFDTIGWNGAEIVINGKQEVEHCMKFSDIAWLMKTFPEYCEYVKVTNCKNDYILMEPKGYVYSLFCMEGVGGYRSIVDMNVTQYLQQEDKLNITHMVYCFRSATQLQQFMDKVHTISDDRLENFAIRQTSKHSLDITNAKATKEQGIITYAALTKTKLNDIAVIGDSKNDIGMFDLIKASYCMRTGDEEAKQHAAHIVDHVEHAIYDLLWKERDK